MTLFANSGVAWPKQEEETSRAGGNVLDAGSTLFQVLASMERGNYYSDRDNLVRSADLLSSAARSYADVAEKLSDEFVDSLSPSEMEEASLPMRRSFDDPLFALFLDKRRVSLHQLYSELSHRTARLSLLISIFDPKLGPALIAPQVFQMMNLWDSMTILARAIAVMGRRREPRIVKDPIMER